MPQDCGPTVAPSQRSEAGGCLRAEIPRQGRENPRIRTSREQQGNGKAAPGTSRRLNQGPNMGEKQG